MGRKEDNMIRIDDTNNFNYIVKATFTGTTIGTEGSAYVERLIVTDDELTAKDKLIEEINSIAKHGHKLETLEYIEEHILQICREHDFSPIIYKM